MIKRRVSSDRDDPDLVALLSQTTSQDMLAWQERLTCVSRRLQREVGARMHRHLVGAESRGDERTAFTWIVERVRETSNAESILLWLLDSRHGELVAHAGAGPSAERRLIGARQGVHVGPSGWVAQNRKSLLLSSCLPADSSHDYEIIPHDGREGMVLQIMVGRHFIGVLEVGPRVSGEPYSADDLETLHFMVEVSSVCCYLASLSNCARSERTSLEDEHMWDHQTSDQKAA